MNPTAEEEGTHPSNPSLLLSAIHDLATKATIVHRFVAPTDSFITRQQKYLCLAAAACGLALSVWLVIRIAGVPVAVLESVSGHHPAYAYAVQAVGTFTLLGYGATFILRRALHPLSFSIAMWVAAVALLAVLPVVQGQATFHSYPICCLYLMASVSRGWVVMVGFTLITVVQELVRAKPEVFRNSGLPQFKLPGYEGWSAVGLECVNFAAVMAAIILFWRLTSLEIQRRRVIIAVLAEVASLLVRYDTVSPRSLLDALDSPFVHVPPRLRAAMRGLLECLDAFRPHVPPQVLHDIMQGGGGGAAPNPLAPTSTNDGDENAAEREAVHGAAAEEPLRDTPCVAPRTPPPFSLDPATMSNLGSASPSPPMVVVAAQDPAFDVPEGPQVATLVRVTVVLRDDGLAIPEECVEALGKVGDEQAAEGGRLLSCASLGELLFDVADATKGTLLTWTGDTAVLGWNVTNGEMPGHARNACAFSQRLVAALRGSANVAVAMCAIATGEVVRVSVKTASSRRGTVEEHETPPFAVVSPALQKIHDGQGDVILAVYERHHDILGRNVPFYATVTDLATITAAGGSVDGRAFGCFVPTLPSFRLGQATSMPMGVYELVRIRHVCPSRSSSGDDKTMADPVAVECAATQRALALHIAGRSLDALALLNAVTMEHVHGQRCRDADVFFQHLHAACEAGGT